MALYIETLDALLPDAGGQMEHGMRSVAQRVMDIEARFQKFEEEPKVQNTPIPSQIDIVREVEKISQRLPVMEPNVARNEEFYPHYNNTVEEIRGICENIGKSIETNSATN